MMLGNFLTNLDNSRVRAYCICNGCRWVGNRQSRNQRTCMKISPFDCFNFG